VVLVWTWPGITAKGSDGGGWFVLNPWGAIWLE